MGLTRWCDCGHNQDTCPPCTRKNVPLASAPAGPLTMKIKGVDGDVDLRVRLRVEGLGDLNLNLKS